VLPSVFKGSIPEAMALVKDSGGELRYFLFYCGVSATPKGLILLRLIPTATHTMEDIEITDALTQYAID
jgi:glycine C-acetyltransferase